VEICIGILMFSVILCQTVINIILYFTVLELRREIINNNAKGLCLK